MDLSVIASVVLAFLLFCMFSSSIYLLNDILDKDKDRRHPKKSKRPIARGLVSFRESLLTSFVLLVLAVALSLFLGESFLFIGLAYWSINLLYSVYLKQLVIIDVMCIAIGFVLRVDSTITNSLVSHLITGLTNHPIFTPPSRYFMTYLYSLFF